MVFSVAANKLTVTASVVGGIIGFLIYAGAGFAGIIMMTVFFVAGTLATSFKLKYKQQLGLAETNKGKRTAAQVIANAGVAAIISVLILLLPKHTVLLTIMMAASFASAIADTVSGELGNVYGHRFYNIRTLQKDKRGLNGVISAEGTLSGIFASAVIAVIYAIAFGWGVHVAIIIIAGTVGNLTDSLLGATLERNHRIGNNAVNFLNTLTASVVAYFLYSLF